MVFTVAFDFGGDLPSPEYLETIEEHLEDEAGRMMMDWLGASWQLEVSRKVEL